MYALNKVYKSSAMAVSAILLTARNKGWQQLEKEVAAQHVWPEADGFVVNNTTLNIAMGFATEAATEAVGQRVPEGAITDGAALEAVSAALAEVNQPDVPATPRKGSIAAMALKKADKEPEVVSKKEGRVTRCNVVNNARRPLRGKTLLVWETTEMLAAGPNGCPSVKEVYEELCRIAPGFNKTTCSIQFYACLAYNGWSTKAK